LDAIEVIVDVDLQHHCWMIRRSPGYSRLCRQTVSKTVVLRTRAVPPLTAR
jgi:hypothetical protein